MKLSAIREKIWMREDRENFFFSGFLLTAIIAAFTTSYWHYQDRTELKPKIKLKASMSREKQYKILREGDYLAPNLRSSSTAFYKIEEYAKPSVPEPSLPDVGTQ